MGGIGSGRNIKVDPELFRKYKEQGHTAQEVAERFGVSRTTVNRYCKGIASQNHSAKWCESHSEKIKANYAESADKRGIVFCEKYAPGFEYVDGYEDRDSILTIKCKKCGNVFTRTGWSIRHNCIVCTVCKRNETEQKLINQEKEKRKRKAERERKQQEWEAERERKAQERWHDCPVCGTWTNRPKYCSKECAKKIANATKDARRRVKIESNMVDADITLSSLFRKDGGVCYICGGKCQYDDFTVVDGLKITGDWYPSIDHVQPLAKGGKHSWENVRLAHRRCNYLKSDNAPWC